MEKNPLYGAGAAVSGAPYTPAVRVGDMVFISGQLGLDPETKQPHAEFAAQVEGAIAGIKALVEAAGGSLDNIVKTTIFLSGDMSRFAELNAIYAAHFSEGIRPARSTFAVAALPLGALVEIEAIAVL
ncbi:Rid family detoxifying hydrolase [Armatimonas sp.]|uniref:RidA family protein n=1 Tax=Armatimonas sp. TaxID=1872638 RepID=UPI00286ACB60|nr:Rid family detoxifying hydrolase [Armatimonas sp.]